jgi:hypothetical protein
MMLVCGGGFAGFYMTLSALPAWLAAHGLSAARAGAATTAMLVATIACQPLVPVLLRRLGTAGTLALGLLALGLPAPALIWSGPGPAVYAISAARGVGFALFTVALTLWVAEIAPPGQEGAMAGLYGLSAAVPQILLLPLSVAILHSWGFGPVAALAGLPAVAVFALAHRDRPSPPPARKRPGAAACAGEGAEQNGSPGGRVDLRAAGARGALAPALVLCAATTVAGAIVTVLPIARRHGGLASVALLLFAGMTAAARWAAGQRIDRHWPRPALTGALGLSLVGLLGVAAGIAGAGAVPLLAGMALTGAGFGAVQSLTLVLAFKRTSAPARALASALWNIAFDAGTAGGALLIGLLGASDLGAGGALALLGALPAAALLPALAAAQSAPAGSWQAWASRAGAERRDR